MLLGTRHSRVIRAPISSKQAERRPRPVASAPRPSAPRPAVQGPSQQISGHVTSYHHTRPQYRPAVVIATRGLATAAPNPKVSRRAAELYAAAARAIGEERWQDSERTLESAISLHQRTLTTDSGVDTLTLKWRLQLAYVKQNLNKLPEAFELYKETMPSADVAFNRGSLDLAIVYVNYGEVLATHKQFSEALQVTHDAVATLRKLQQDEILAAALQNIATYLVATEKWQEAKPFGAESLKLFINKLGRKNEIVKAAWSNYYNICEKLGLKDELADLETDWKALHEPEVGAPTGLSDKQLGLIGKKMEQRLHGYSSGSAAGVVKDPSLTQEELGQFLENWQKQGLSVDEDGNDEVLAQEMKTMKAASEIMTATLKREAYKKGKAASEMSEDWKKMVVDIEDLTKNIANIQQTIDQAAADAEKQKKRAQEAAARREELMKKPIEEFTEAEIIANKDMIKERIAQEIYGDINFPKTYEEEPTLFKEDKLIENLKAEGVWDEEELKSYLAQMDQLRAEFPGRSEDTEDAEDLLGEESDEASQQDPEEDQAQQKQGSATARQTAADANAKAQK